jgi:hypothetical protein
MAPPVPVKLEGQIWLARPAFVAKGLKKATAVPRSP